MTKRREVPTQYPDITKIQVLGSDGKWIEPRCKKFKARRYQKQPDGTLERIKRSFETLAEARMFRQGSPLEDKKEEKIPAPAPIVFSQSSAQMMTLEELIESWKINWLPTLNIATQLRYTDYLKHFGFLLKTKVAEIEPAHIDAWITYVKRPEYVATCHSTRCSFEHEFKILRSILKYYNSRINRNYRLPFLRDHMKMLKVKEKPIVTKDLTMDQLAAFLRELRALCWETKWEVIYYMAVMQYSIYGRIQEAAALFVEDFDLANNRLEVKRKVQWLRVRGYEDKVVAGSKTNGGKIFSPIPEAALQVFNEWRLRSGVRSGLLFRIDGEVIAYRQIQHKYDQALKRAKLPFRSTHILRHASLVEAYSTTTNILAVQKLAGHKSLKATEKYAKVRDEQLAEVQRRMDEKLSSLLR